MKLPMLPAKLFVFSVLMLVAALAVLTSALNYHAWVENQQIRGQVSQDDPNAAGPQVGNIAPDFALPDLFGQKRTLSSFRGKPVVLGFFCGCDRCHAAALKIGALQREGELKNFVAVVSLPAPEAASFCRRSGLRADVLVDPSDDTAEAYDSDFCPRLWIVSGEGLIKYRSDIALEGDELNAALKQLNTVNRRN